MYSRYKKILIISLIVIAGIGVPLAAAHAFDPITIGAVISVIGSLLTSLGKAALGVAKEFGLIAGKFGIAMAVSQIGIIFANSFLHWAANPNLIKVGVIDNAFVTAGWEVVRDFVNLFFILIVIAVGIATALRIKGYEVRKILPRLILIAILINFTPVICGLLIDASEIIMDFFFRAGTEGFTGIINLSKTSAGSLGTMLGEAIRNPTDIFTGKLLFKAIALTVFNCVAAFIMITLGLLFIVRHVALWTLVILSPLAFFSFILPATKRIWNMWWQQFIRWSFIGVGAAFFLYLAQVMMQEMTRLMDEPSAEAFGLDSGLTFMLVQSIPLIFLMIGVFVTSSTSAMGASQVINLTRRGAKWTKSKAGMNLRRQLGAMGRRGAEPFKEKLGEWASRVGAEAPKKWKGVPGKEKAKLPYYWARQRVAKKVLKGTAEAEIKELQKLIEEYKKLTTEGRTLQVRTAKTDVERIAAIVSKAEKGEIDDITSEEIANAIRKAGGININVAKDIMKAHPGVAQEIYEEKDRELINIDLAAQDALRSGNLKKNQRLLKELAEKQAAAKRQGLLLTAEDRQAGYDSLEAKLMAMVKDKDIPKMSEKFLTSDEAQKFIHDFWRGSQVAKAAREFERPFVNSFNKELDKRETDTQTYGDYYYYDNRNQLWKYLNTGPAQELGLKAAKGPSDPKKRPPQPRPQPTPPPGPPPTGPGPGPGAGAGMGSA